MLSKAKIKQINALRIKKHRDSSGLFIAESNKVIQEVFDSDLTVKYLVATSQWIEKHGKELSTDVFETDENTFRKISSQTTPQQVLAVMEKPQYTINSTELSKKLFLVLDDIQDPGNLGTLIRLADWFGISDIICSKETADLYNPKTIQSTMGAFLRVRVHYLDLNDFFEEMKGIPVYGTFLDGESVHKSDLTDHGAILLGNEGNGISEKLTSFITQRITIPKVGIAGSESLNVAIAGAIIVSSFFRDQ